MIVVTDKFGNSVVFLNNLTVCDIITTDITIIVKIDYNSTSWLFGYSYKLLGIFDIIN